MNGAAVPAPGLSGDLGLRGAAIIVTGASSGIDARQRGELIHLRPGEQRRYELELGALTGAEAVEAFRARNQELAQGATA